MAVRDRARFLLDDFGPMFEGRLIRNPATGDVFEIVQITSGRMPTPIDTRISTHSGSTSERCALYGTTARDPGLKRNRKVRT